MDYRRHYDRLIARARTRVLVGYAERHHVVPRCLGGDDSPENLVLLTPEEHFVAHQLLVRLHPGHAGILFAVQAMTMTNPRQVRSNRLYGWLKRRIASTSESEITRAKKRAASLARWADPAFRERRRQGHARARERMSASAKARIERDGNPMSRAEARANHAAAVTAPEYRAKISEKSRRPRKQRKVSLV